MWAITILVGSTPAFVSASSASSPVFAGAFVCTITGTPVSTAAAATTREDARHVGDDPVLLDGALEERGLDARVVDAFADLADEELDQRVVAAVGEEARQLEKGVDAARDDDVQVDLGIDPLDARDVAAEPRRGRVDDRADPTVSQPLQLRDRRRRRERPRPSSSHPRRARSSGAPPGRGRRRARASASGPSSASPTGPRTVSTVPIEREPSARAGVQPPIVFCR